MKDVAKGGCLHRFTRDAYYGGRVEVFRERFDCTDASEHRGLGYNVLNYGDVNSMYPWAMLGAMPTELSFVREGKIDVEQVGKKYLGFVRCKVVVPRDCYLPPLPYRSDGKLIFPTGVFSGTWTSEELATLRLVGGRIIRVDSSVWFRGRPIFTDYVRYWYAFRDKMKRDYDLAMDMIAKLFLNSLYGKMGMNSERERLWFFPTDEEFDNHKLVPLNPETPQFGAYKEVTHSEPPYVIPHIAAWVTSRSRVRLWRLMLDFITKGYRLYYCDTDSVVTDGPITDSAALGDLKTVCQILRAKFVAPKMYFIKQANGEHFIKAKGFSAGFGAKSLTEDEFNSIIEHREKVGIQRMRKMREGMRTKQTFPAMLKTLKGVRSGILDEKRIHLPDGNTKPIHLE